MPSSEKRALSKINLLDDFGEYKKAGQKTGLCFAAEITAGKHLQLWFFRCFWDQPQYQK